MISRGRWWLTSPAHQGEREAAVKTIAQGMFWQETVNKINCKSGLYPPLCRDPLQPILFFNRLLAEVRACALRPPG
jgi:hypothetical protein